MILPQPSHALHVLPDQKTLVRNVANSILDTALSAVAERGMFTIVLAGGSTPRPLYELLVQAPYQETMPWDQTFIFWGDERYVARDHPDSNFGMAYNALLRHVSIPESRLFPFETNVTPEADAAAYEKLLRSFFQEDGGADYCLLGLGTDGHTASLFPGSDILYEQEKWVGPVMGPSLSSPRLSLTYPFILKSRSIHFMIQGSNKQPAVADTWRKGTVNQIPARRIHEESDRVVWHLDRAAFPES